MKLELHTRFVFGKIIGSTIVDITADNKEVWIKVREEEEHEDSGHSIYLDPQEIDLFISTLNFYKNKILNPRKEAENE